MMIEKLLAQAQFPVNAIQFPQGGNFSVNFRIADDLEVIAWRLESACRVGPHLRITSQSGDGLPAIRTS